MEESTDNGCKRSSNSDETLDIRSNGALPKKFRTQKNGTIKTKTVLKSKKTQDSDDASSQQDAVLFSQPGFYVIQGALSRKSPTDIYLDVSNNLWKFFSLNVHMCDQPTIFKHAEYLLTKPKLEKSPDIAVARRIQSYVALANITANSREYLKKLKKIQQDITDMTVVNESALMGLLYYQLFCFYMRKNKIGKASSILSHAQASIQGLKPSAWTAQVMEAQAMMYLCLGHIFSLRISDFHKKAYECYRLAMEHCLQENTGVHEWNCAYYLMQMTYITLQIPVTLLFISNKLKEPLQSDFQQNILHCFITECDLKKAANMLSFVQKHYKHVLGKDITGNFHMFFCNICLRIRQAQIEIKLNHFKPALDYIVQARENCKEWLTIHTIMEDRRFIAICNIEKVLEVMEENIWTCWRTKEVGNLLLHHSHDYSMSSDWTSLSDFSLSDLSYQIDQVGLSNRSRNSF